MILYWSLVCSRYPFYSVWYWYIFLAIDITEHPLLRQNIPLSDPEWKFLLSKCLWNWHSNHYSHYSSFTGPFCALVFINDQVWADSGYLGQVHHSRQLNIVNGIVKPCILPNFEAFHLQKKKESKEGSSDKIKGLDFEIHLDLSIYVSEKTHVFNGTSEVILIVLEPKWVDNFLEGGKRQIFIKTQNLA